MRGSDSHLDPENPWFLLPSQRGMAAGMDGGGEPAGTGRPALFGLPVDHPDFLWLHGIRTAPCMPVDPCAYLHILSRYDAPYPERAIAGLVGSLAHSRQRHQARMATAGSEAERAAIRAFASACELVNDTAQDMLSLTGDAHAALRAALAVCASNAVPVRLGSALALEMLQAATTAPAAAADCSH